MLKIIVIVDDEEDLIVNLKIQMESLRPDLKIMGYNNGMDALKDIVTSKVDLVLTDIAMPDMDGYELFWRIKEHNPSLPVIMMTGFGYDPNHVLVRAKSDGLRDVLFKPFPIEKLLDLIDQKLKP